MNRDAYVDNIRTTLKTLAENLNFASWDKVNEPLLGFNEIALLNPEFEKTIISTFLKGVQESFTPVKKGSELEKKKFKYMATVDLSEFKHLFSLRSDLSAFDVSDAKNFQIAYKGKKDGKDMDVKVTIDGSGEKAALFSNRLSNDSAAVIILLPEKLDFKFARNGVTSFTVSMNNKIEKASGSEYGDLQKSKWSIGGKAHATIKEGDKTIDDAEMEFSFGLDPKSKKGDVALKITQNGRSIVDLKATNKSSDFFKDFSSLTSASNILDFVMIAVNDGSIDDLKLTLLGFKTLKMKITDTEKAASALSESSEARRNYADSATIAKYTKKLNDVMTLSLTDESLDMTVPVKFQTTKFGVDYWVMPCFDFGDEVGFVPMSDIMDPEALSYLFNILDHSIPSISATFIVLRQIVRFAVPYLISAGTEE